MIYNGCKIMIYVVNILLKVYNQCMYLVISKIYPNFLGYYIEYTNKKNDVLGVCNKWLYLPYMYLFFNVLII